MEPGDIAFLTKDIFIDGQLAFSDNEQVIIEKVQANEQRPDYEYVVVSRRLLKRFQLRDEDLRIGNKEAIKEPSAISKPLNEMLKLQKKAYSTQNRNSVTVVGGVISVVVLVIGVILIGIPVYRYYSPAYAASRALFSFWTWINQVGGSMAICLVFGILITLGGLSGLIAAGFFALAGAGSGFPLSSKQKEPCPSCGALIPANALVCRFCKTSLSAHRFCVQCGTPLEPGKHFCTNCGART